MSTSDPTDDTSTDDEPIATFAIEYEAKVTLGTDISLTESEAVLAVTEALATWDQSREDTNSGDTTASETPGPTREFRRVEYDPQRPALGISLRVHSIPEHAAPDVGYNAIQSLLDELGRELGVEFGAARDVGVIR